MHALKTREKTRVEKTKLRTCRNYDFYILICLVIDNCDTQNLVYFRGSVQKLFKNLVFLFKASQFLCNPTERVTRAKNMKRVMLIIAFHIIIQGGDGHTISQKWSNFNNGKYPKFIKNTREKFVRRLYIYI